MKLRIKIKDKVVDIALAKNNKAVDQITFAEDYNLSEKLLPAIDKLLKENKLAPKDIKKITVETDTPGSFTTSRIAKAVGKAFNFALDRFQGLC